MGLCLLRKTVFFSIDRSQAQAITEKPANVTITETRLAAPFGNQFPTNMTEMVKTSIAEIPRILRETVG